MSATTEVTYYSSVSMLLSSEDSLHYSLRLFQKALHQTSQQTHPQSLNRNNFHEKSFKASKQSALFNNNLSSLTVYPLGTFAL